MARNMSDTDYRYLLLLLREGENTAEEKTFLMKQNQVHLKAALRMPMFKNLPTHGFKYDWNQFLFKDGLFFVPPNSFPVAFEIINGHVGNLNPEEMDVFCADVFDKLSARSEKILVAARRVPNDGMRRTHTITFEGIFQDLGVQNSQDPRVEGALWDWAMNFVAARTLWIQDNSQKKVPGPTRNDAAGGDNVADQPSKNKPDPEFLGLAAQAVDRFIAIGDRNFRVREVPLVGPHIGIGGPKWLGWDFKARTRSPEREAQEERFLSEALNRDIAAQVSSNEVDVDDSVVALHDIAIEQGRTAPPALTSLVIRTAKPLKRRREDDDEPGAIAEDDEPLAKMPKVLQVQTKTSAATSRGDSRTAVPVFANLAIRTSQRLKQRRANTRESGADTADGEPLEKTTKAAQGQNKTSGSPTQLDEH